MTSTPNPKNNQGCINNLSNNLVDNLIYKEELFKDIQDYKNNFMEFKTSIIQKLSLMEIQMESIFIILLD